jgi:diacylglycerol kinase (ATP)
MKYLLLYNPVSGRSTICKHLSYIQRRFEKEGLKVDIYESKRERDLIDQAHLKSGDYDVFVVAGGDGTINEVVNGVMRAKKRPAIAVVPSGTANDIAAILGIRRSIRHALNVIFREEAVSIDINRMNEHYFVYTAAAGVLTRISYDVSRRRLKKYGYLAYVFEGMKDLSQDYRFPLEIRYNGKKVENEYMLVLGLSSNRVGGVFLKNFAHSKLNDGLFEIRLFETRRKFRRFRLLSFFLRRGKKLREDEHLVSSSFKIKADPDVCWNADGELAARGSVEIKVFQEQIRFYMSKKTKKRYF